ncbi:hypothetical protein HYS31_08335 [Candidatus Woesearchaeota archaeon]|nr:hypothetical protein [Candidatus Woesearchaeota archaeon]
MVKRLLVLLILIIALAPFTLAYDLSDFPEPFVFEGRYNSFIVLADRYSAKDYFAAIDVFNILSKFENATKPCQSWVECERRIGSSPMKLVTEIDSRDLLKDKNIISIGGPCANKITAQIMDLPTTWPECANGFEEGKGRIILYNKWNKFQIIVAGFSQDNTRMAAKVIESYSGFNPTGKELQVTGTMINLSVKRVITEEEKKYCEKDDDCVFYSCSCCPVCNPPPLNKRYLPDCNKNCSGIACIQSVCVLTTYPKCVNKSCTSVSLKYCENTNECLSSKPWGCISKGLCKIFNDQYKNGKSDYPCYEVRNETCQCINNECPNEQI